MKMGDFLYGFWKSGEWKLILPSNFVFAGKNYYEPLIDEAHVVPAHGGVEKIMQYLTDRYRSQWLSTLIHSFVVRCDTCPRVTPSNKPPLAVVTPLHVLVRLWTDIWMHFLKLTPVFIKCSTMYPNIEIDNDHMLCSSCIWTIVNRHSAYKFLIAITDNLKAQQRTSTYEVHLLPHIRDTNPIPFDRDSSFMSGHFLALATSKRILSEPWTAYHYQTHGQTEIVNQEVVTIVCACEFDGYQGVKKLPAIQVRQNSRYDSSHSGSPFDTLYGFTPRFGEAQMAYTLNKRVAETDRHV